jgi:predicted dehydrogenase
MKRLNIALIGFGNMGRTHSYAVQNLKFYYGADDPTATAKIIGVCTSKKETAQIAAEKYGLDKAYWNEDELIFSDETDIVDISTPNLLHYETLKKAIAAGKHIYCEKPLCTKARQAAEIAELIKGTGLKGQIVHNYRFMGPVVRAKQLIEEGRLGKIVSFDISYYHSSSTDVTKPVGWKQDGAYGGGVLWDLGSHAVDLIYHLCGKFRTVDGMQQIAHPLRAGVDGKPWKTDADDYRVKVRSRHKRRSEFYDIRHKRNGEIRPYGSELAVVLRRRCSLRRTRRRAGIYPNRMCRQIPRPRR